MPGRCRCKAFYYHDDNELQEMSVDPSSVGISQPKCAVPIPGKLPKTKNKGDEIATTVDTDADAGIAALDGKTGPAYTALSTVPPSVCPTSNVTIPFRPQPMRFTK